MSSTNATVYAHPVVSVSAERLEPAAQEVLRWMHHRGDVGPYCLPSFSYIGCFSTQSSPIIPTQPLPLITLPEQWSTEQHQEFIKRTILLTNAPDAVAKAVNAAAQPLRTIPEKVLFQLMRSRGYPYFHPLVPVRFYRDNGPRALVPSSIPAERHPVAPPINEVADREGFQNREMPRRRPTFESGSADTEAAQPERLSDGGGSQKSCLSDAGRTNFRITSGSPAVPTCDSSRESSPPLSSEHTLEDLSSQTATPTPPPATPHIRSDKGKGKRKSSEPDDEPLPTPVVQKPTKSPRRDRHRALPLHFRLPFAECAPKDADRIHAIFESNDSPEMPTMSLQDLHAYKEDITLCGIPSNLVLGDLGQIAPHLGKGIFLNPNLTESIPAGEFIGFYGGNFILRSKVEAPPGDYAFVVVRDLENDEYLAIEGKDVGNFSRFVNHTDPKNANVREDLVKVVDSEGKWTIQVGYFTQKEIQPGEQFLLYYGEKYNWPTPPETPSPVTYRLAPTKGQAGQHNVVRQRTTKSPNKKN